MDCVELRKRYMSADSARSSIKGAWDLIERFVVPLRGKVFLTVMDNNSLDWRERQLFDSTAVDACQTLSSSIHGALTSNAYKWFDLIFDIEALNKNMEAIAWLQECGSIIWQHLQESNFNLEASELYLDLCSFGTGFLVLEIEGDYETFNGLDFKSIPIRESCFEQDHKGHIVFFYRKMEWTALQCVEKFGMEKVPEQIRKQAEDSGNVDARHEVIFAIYKRRDKQNVDTSKRLAPKNRPYGWKYFLLEGAEQLGDEGGYYEMPAFAPRWRKTSGAVWGYSPAFVALYDILTLNQLKELMLGALEKVVDPATITTNRGVIGDLDLSAGGNTVVRSIADIKPFESAARFDVSQMSVEDLRGSIRRAFFVDQLELPVRSGMTATEISARLDLMQRLLGPTMGRLQSDFLDPLIKRAFAILFRARKFPAMPSIVAEMQGQYNIEYTGPMARSQKTAVVEAINRWLMMTAQMAEMYPEMRDLAKIDDIGRDTALMTGVPARHIRSTKELEQLRQKRQQEAQQMQQLAMMQQGGAALEQMGKGAAALQNVMPEGVNAPI